MAACAKQLPTRPDGHGDLTANACTSCRKVKMKCLFDDDAAQCRRCIRLSLECVREKHRRGRKLGTRLKTAPRNKPPESARPSSPLANVPVYETPAPKASAASSRRESLEAWSTADGFQPPDLLNKEQAIGRFSLRTVLDMVSDKTKAAEPGSSQELGGNGGRDPIDLGIVNHAVAVSLFRAFMQNLNPWICQFDPVIYSFDAVRQQSSFLLTAVLAAAAKTFNPAMRRPLQVHAEGLLSEAFLHGTRSVDVIHAILVLTCWKDPEDTRAWLYIGHAIRISHELGWQRLRIKTGTDGHRAHSESDMRALRNIERLWLLLFVYDRSISFETGNPWMIERDEVFFEARHSWHRHPLATPNDKLLCALVDLRLLTSDTFRPSLRTRRRRGSEDSQFDQRGSLVRIILYDIGRWQTRWLPLCGAEKCHSFVIRFFGAHLRLLISSSPLEASLSSSSEMQNIDKRALWLCFSSATDMVRLLAGEGVSSALYFAPDTVHVMTAYAAVFLIKLCLSIPAHIRIELEGTVVDALHNAAEAFRRQAAPSNTACALQASFLANVVRALKNTDSRRPSDGEMDENHQDGAQWSAAPSVGPQMSDVDDGENEHEQAEEENDTVSGLYRQPHNEAEDEPAALYTGAVSTLLPASNVDRGLSSSAIVSADGSTGAAHGGDNLYADDALWATLFSNAGFSIDEGIFVPHGRGQQELG